MVRGLVVLGGRQGRREICLAECDLCRDGVPEAGAVGVDGDNLF